jgi:uncharacterized repeat protein (TIGR01451 family)
MSNVTTRGALALAMLALVALAAPAAWAIGTPAGTPITNQATVNFTDVNGNPLSQLSNTVTTIVAQVAGVDISPAALAQNADPGDLVCYAHVVTNTGNGSDTVDLTTASTQTWTGTLYHDVGVVGTYEPGIDTALTNSGGAAAVDTGALAANGALNIIVCVQVPAGTANGTVDQTTITGTSVFAPASTDAATDTTTINAPDLTVVKSVAPLGDQPPLTVLTYTIVVTNNGSANALSIVLTDPIPAFTTYQAGSIRLNGIVKTDVNLDDEADFNLSNPGQVTVNIGTLAPAASATVTFQVRIN